MLRRYPQTLRWRQGLPPLFVLSLPVLALAGLFWNLFWILLGVELLAYAGVLLAAGLVSAFKRREPGLVLGLPLSVAIMHITWGSGFLWSIIKGMTEINKAGIA
jgi:succinoglycan biosynthesis protein ExoA